MSIQSEDTERPTIDWANGERKEGRRSKPESERAARNQEGEWDKK